MSIKQLTSEGELKMYNSWITTHLDGTLWQSLERKKYLEAIGKTVRIYAIKEGEKITASAMVVIDRTSFGFSTWDIPRGPIFINEEFRMKNEELLLQKIIDDAKKGKCLSLYFSPSFSILNSQFSIKNSDRHIHCEATSIIDLTKPEDELLKNMKPKGRYNIRVAQKHGVRIELSNDINGFYELIKETSGRDGFIVLPKKKYQAFLKDLLGSFLLLAYVTEKNEPIAGLLGVVWPPDGMNGLPAVAEGRRGARNEARLRQGFGDQPSAKVGTYYYGASSYAHRASMAPYALQWKAMQICKQSGCETYDLLGIAPPNSPKNHPWQGITSFKEKFGGTLVMYPPEQEIVLRPIMNRLLTLKRKIL